MMGEPSDESKMELLWRDYEQRLQSAEKKAGEGRSMLSSIPDKVLIYILMAAMALGMGPETATKILNIMVPK